MCTIICFNRENYATDPRADWVQMGDGSPVPKEMFGNLCEMIGAVEGIDVSISEGGNLGLPDLAKDHGLRMILKEEDAS
jgi:hypothetical protein